MVPKHNFTLKHLLTQFSPSSWWLSFFLWLVIVIPAQAAVELRVAIKKNVSSVQIGSSTPAVVKDVSGRTLGEISPMNGLTARNFFRGVAVNKWSAKELLIEPSEDGFVWIGDRWYRGKTRLIRDRNGITAINQVDIESYLYSVVGAESYPNWPLEALKAQAVAARTYALYKRNSSKKTAYDLDTTVGTQVYKGVDSEYVTTHQAVDSTTGQIVTYQGKPILAVFHSSSGGYTENVEDIWNSPLPYLRGVVDYDRQAPVFEWTKTFSAYELSNRIGGVGRITALVPEKTTPKGRIVTLKVIGVSGSKRISGTNFRQALEIPSTLFQVSTDSNNFILSGRGYGHGIGMSQWGSYYLAQQGVSYQNILSHYYQNSQLSSVTN